MSNYCKQSKHLLVRDRGAGTDVAGQAIHSLRVDPTDIFHCTDNVTKCTIASHYTIPNKVIRYSMQCGTK